MKTRTSEHVEQKVYRTLSFTFDMNSQLDRENYDLMVEFANELLNRKAELPVIDVPKFEAKPESNKNNLIHTHKAYEVLQLLETGRCHRDEIASTLDISINYMRHCIHRLRSQGYNIKSSRKLNSYELVK